MNFDAATRQMLQDLMVWRRDVRSFLSDPIPEATIERLQGAMGLAPSVGNSRPWRILRIEKPALRDAVRDAFKECNAEAAATYESDRAAHYRALKLAGLDKAPLQLAVFTECAPEAGHGLGRQTIPETLQQSTAMAIHTLWLAARAENIGLGMVSILNPKRIEQIFNVPVSWRFSSYLCLGWPESEDDKPLLHRSGWQHDALTRWVRR